MVESTNTSQTNGGFPGGSVVYLGSTKIKTEIEDSDFKVVLFLCCAFVENIRIKRACQFLQLNILTLVLRLVNG